MPLYKSSSPRDSANQLMRDAAGTASSMGQQSSSTTEYEPPEKTIGGGIKSGLTGMLGGMSVAETLVPGTSKALFQNIGTSTGLISSPMSTASKVATGLTEAGAQTLTNAVAPTAASQTAALGLNTGLATGAQTLTNAVAPTAATTLAGTAGTVGSASALGTAATGAGMWSTLANTPGAAAALGIEAASVGAGTAAGATTGTVAGGTAGAAAGPIGAGIGAAIGLVGGLLSYFL